MSERSRELYVLGMLSRGRTHGHELMKAVRVSRADMWVALSEKHVYYVLRRLAARGLVTETEERVGSRPPRKVYELTASGREELASLLRSPALRDAFVPSPFDAVVGILAYSDVLDRDASVEVLAARRETLARRLDEHPAEAGEAVEKLYGYLARSLYEKARALLVTELAWMDDVLAKVRSGRISAMRVPRNFLRRDDGRST